MNAKKMFKVMLNGELTDLHLANYSHFEAENLRGYPFGDLARQSGEAPIKAVVVFKDGVPQSLRGDRYTGKPVEMLRNLHKLCLKYIQAKQLAEVKIYDNRGLLPDIKTKLILEWSESTNVLINLLPLYSGEFDINKVKAA
jgi:hypothetical protein